VPGYLEPGQPTTLTATASDADGDVLGYAWTSTCASGSFADPTASATTFTLPSGASDSSCGITVTVADGRGGSTSGETSLPVGKPVAIEAPTITGSVQSTALVEAGATVNFAITAMDPQGGALSFRWVATLGSLGSQVDGLGTSQIAWTAPAVVAPTFTVSVIVTDSAGASTELDFVVAGDCACSGTSLDGPVTVACGQTVCGTDSNTWTCSAANTWSGPGQACGPCQCSGTSLDGPVTVACGQTVCGTESNTWTCSAANTWSGPGQPCGPCQCSGTSLDGPVTVACGQSTCGTDNRTYACSRSGWSATGSTCP